MDTVSKCGIPQRAAPRALKTILTFISEGRGYSGWKRSLLSFAGSVTGLRINYLWRASLLLQWNWCSFCACKKCGVKVWNSQVHSKSKYSCSDDYLGVGVYVCVHWQLALKDGVNFLTSICVMLPALQGLTGQGEAKVFRFSLLSVVHVIGSQFFLFHLHIRA